MFSSDGRRLLSAGAVERAVPRVIVTPALLRHLERHRQRPAALALPIGHTAITRLRRLLGHHRQMDAAAWWDERADDLADLTIEAFAAAHGRSVGAIVNARHALFGRRLRPAGWWRAPDVVEVLLADRPRADIADALGISVGSVGRLRHCCRSVALTADDPRSDLGSLA